MAAAQVTGTPAESTEATAATAEVTTETTESGDPIADALADYKPDEEPDGPGGAEAKPEPKPEEKPEPKPEEQGKRKRADVEAEIFAEAALATPEGVAKAREYLGRRRSKLDGIEIRVKEQRAELEQQAEIIRAEYERANAEIETDRARARAIAEIDRRLSTGTVEEMLDTLGKLRGKSGKEVWDEMARAAIQGRVQGPAAPSPEVAELREQIAGLTRMLEEREHRHVEVEAERIAAEVKGLEAAVVATASDSTKYPALAGYARLGLGENIIAEVVRLKSEARASGRPLDNAGALAQIEAELKRLSPAGASPARSEVAGQSTSVPAGAIPSSPAAAIADDVPVTGIAPSQTRSASALREKTQAELDADLRRDTAFLRELGFEPE